MPEIHDLKIHPEPFAEAKAGRKPYEVRREDRAFSPGDLVRLREWDPFARAYTGEELEPVAITAITRGHGLLDGYVVLGLGYGLPAFTPRLLELQAEVDQRRAEAARWGAFVVQLADALDVTETLEFGKATGYVEDHLLSAARRLVTLGSPMAPARVHRALDLIQDAHATFLLGSGTGAKDKAAQAAVELTALIEGVEHLTFPEVG